MSSPDDLRPPKSIASKLTAWGSSAIPPMSLTSLIIALHARPLQPLPALFAPLLAFSSYLTLAGFRTDGAGMTAAWSGLYALLAVRGARRERFRASSSPPPGGLLSLRSRLPSFSLRGLVRAGAVGLGAANAVAGLYTYATGDRKKEEEERRELNRWGVYKD